MKPDECGQVDAVVGFAKGFSRSRNAVPERKRALPWRSTPLSDKDFDVSGA